MPFEETLSNPHMNSIRQERWIVKLLKRSENRQYFQDYLFAERSSVIREAV
jgi:hypothetical protein